MLLCIVANFCELLLRSIQKQGQGHTDSAGKQRVSRYQISQTAKRQKAEGRMQKAENKAHSPPLPAAFRLLPTAYCLLLSPVQRVAWEWGTVN